MKTTITASIVIFENKEIVLKRAIESVLRSPELQILYLIDNSKTDKFKNISADDRIIYLKTPKNIGFGAAHNLAIRQTIEIGSEFHFVVNPDIYFEENVLEKMVQKMQNEATCGLMMPKVLNLDGTIQFLPKFLPSPFYMIWRKIKFPQKSFQKFINNYELRIAPPEMTYIAPRISGCFCLMNLEIIKEIGVYDERFFMYFEDSDLSRRVYQRYKTIYFHEVSVFHAYESGANKKPKLFFWFVISAIKYFNKWGWFFDRERKEIGSNTITQIMNSLNASLIRQN